MKKIFRVLTLCLLFSVLSVCLVFGSSAETSPAESVFVDLDLSAMSGTVVYAQVYNMMVEPQAWLGKMIRMAGYYNYYDDQEHGIVYHACIIPDATACCAQGIEFVWAGEHAWPDEYPEIGTDIVITGRLEMYEEDGSKYLHLVDADLILAQSREIQQ